MNRRLSPPSGMPAPQRVTAPRGSEVDLVEVARETFVAYDAEFPDERARYGPAGMDWCRHDVQHLLNWAVLSLTQDLDYERQPSWLARVLEARDFPLPRLARCLELLATITRRSVPTEPEVADRAATAAAFISSRSSFL
ncbi:MAG: hypothetical protein ACJ780_24490 [Solirubrobacteraceae bacterium]